MDAFEQDRIQLHIRLLVDSTTDWAQCTITAMGVDPDHLLAMDVRHPVKLLELPVELPRILLRSMEILRVNLPPGGLRQVDQQTF